MAQFTLTDVRVFTGAGRSDSRDVDVDGAVITDVRPHSSGAAASDTLVEGGGRTLLPGLIDTHVHLDGRANLDAAIHHGVTTMIDLGTHPASLVDGLRNQQGTTDIRSAGSAASAPGSVQSTTMGFPPDSVVTSPRDAERYLDWCLTQGNDLIKIIIEDPHIPAAAALSPETITALVSGAHERGLQTVAHTVTAFSYQMGADAGVDVLTHAPLDRPIADALVEQLRRQGTVVCPTLIMMKGVAAARAGAPGPTLSLEHCLQTVQRLHAAGVPIVAGTDAHTMAHPAFAFEVAHGTSMHDELALLVQSGLSASEALHAATTGAASHLRLNDRGAIEPGKRADLVLVEGDPTADITASSLISGVWAAGTRAR